MGTAAAFTGPSFLSLGCLKEKEKCCGLGSQTDPSGRAASTTCWVFSQASGLSSVCFLIYKIRGNDDDTYLAGLLGGFNGTNLCGLICHKCP